MAPEKRTQGWQDAGVSFDLDDLRRAWSSPPDASGWNRARAEVSGWSWTRGGRDDDWYGQPLQAARYEHALPRKLRKEPKRLHGVQRYGRNAHGQLVIADELWQGDVTESMLVVSDADQVRRYERNERGEVFTVCLARIDTGGRTTEAAFGQLDPGVRRWEFERYEYDADGRLGRVHFERSVLGNVQVGVQEIVWSADRLEAVYESSPEGVRMPRWTRYIRVDERWEELAARALPLLVEQYRALLEQHERLDSRRLALVALDYSSREDPSLPFVLWLCPAENLTALIAELGWTRPVLLPAEWSQEPVFPDPPGALRLTLRKMSALILQDSTGTDRVLRLAVDVARALADAKLTVLEGAAVYAMDAVGEDLERTVPATVDSDQLNHWRQAGLDL